MILTHIRTRFADAFFPRLMEWQAALVMCVGGILMIGNPTLMADSAIGYDLMLRWADQATWGQFATLLGTVRLMVLAVNGAWRRSPHARAVAAFLSCAVWFPLYVSFSAAAGWGMVFAAGVLFGDLLNIVRTMRDARVVDDTYRGRGADAGQ
jgi:hypothetical protein